MIWTIAKKEFLSNLMTFRFLVGLLLYLGLSVSSTYVLSRDYQDRLKVYQEAVQAHQAEVKEVKVFSDLKVTLDRRPTPLSIVAQGEDRSFGRSVTVAYDKVQAFNMANYMDSLVERAAVVDREGADFLVEGTRFWIPLRIAYAERMAAVSLTYQAALMRQVRLARTLASCSPAWVLGRFAEIMAETSVEAHRAFLSRARQYRQILVAYMELKGGLSTTAFFCPIPKEQLPSASEVELFQRQWIRMGMPPFKHPWLSWEAVPPLDLRDMPHFDVEGDETGTVIVRVLPILGGLMGTNILLFLICHMLFLRRELTR